MAAKFPEFDILALALAPLDLPMQDLDDQEDFALSKKENEERFGAPVRDNDLARAIEERIPDKTKKTTQWAYSVWQSWCEVRCVTQPLREMPVSDIDQHLSRFIMEARRQNGSPYPPKTLYQLVCGLQRYLRESARPEVAIFDDKNPTFDTSRKVLDARMKKLTSEGVGTVTRSAQPLSPEHEGILWSKGLFSIKTAEGLTNAVFWYNCKCFGLRGGDEHRQLVVEQYTIGGDHAGRFLRFVGRSSKNVQGGLKQRNVKSKDLKIYASPSLGERCVVDIFSTYMALIPRNGSFYRRPIKGSSAPPRYSAQVIGKNFLQTIVARFCAKAGFEGNFTNHSGKVTCATTLFSKNFDEQLIQRQTGHRSNAVRVYKRPTTAHDVAVSNALQPPPQKAEEKKLDDGQQACCSYSAHRSQPQNIDCTLVPQGVSINISINQ